MQMKEDDVRNYLKGFTSIQQLGSILAVLRVIQAGNTETPNQELVDNIMLHPLASIVKATEFIQEGPMLTETIGG